MKRVLAIQLVTLCALGLASMSTSAQTIQFLGDGESVTGCAAICASADTATGFTTQATLGTSNFSYQFSRTFKIVTADPNLPAVPLFLALKITATAPSLQNGGLTIRVFDQACAVPACPGISTPYELGSGLNNVSGLGQEVVSGYPPSSVLYFNTNHAYTVAMLLNGQPPAVAGIAQQQFQQSLSIWINPPYFTFPYLPTSPQLPSAISGKPYGPFTLAATSGIGALTWFVTGLPPGFTFDPKNNMLSSTGTPVAPPGIYKVTLSVTDSRASIASSTLNLEVDDAGYPLQAGFQRNPFQEIGPDQDPLREETMVASGGGASASIPLGAVFYLRLGQKDGTGTVTIPATYALESQNVSPPIPASETGPNNLGSLFSDKAVIEFNPNVVETDKTFQAMHLGTVNIRITPQDFTIKPVLVTITVHSQNPLGKLGNSIDSLIYQVAHLRGIPPQLVKGQVHQESAKYHSNPIQYNESAYRYEPCFDARYVSRGPDPLIDHTPFSLFALKTANGAIPADGAQLLAADRDPRLKYRLNYQGPCQVLSAADSLKADPISAQNYIMCNPGEHFVGKGCPTDYNFTAQTPVSASYGYLQVLLSTAVKKEHWSAGGKNNPSLLFDVGDSLQNQTSSIWIGSRHLIRLFLAVLNEELAKSSYSSPTDLLSDYDQALLKYNGGGNFDYPFEVEQKSTLYGPYPQATGTIFGK